MTLEELSKIPKDSMAMLNKVYDEAKAGTKQLYEEGQLLRKQEARLRLSARTEASSGGGWILSRSQMRFLSEKPYLYNASAGSYLELLFLQK